MDLKPLQDYLDTLPEQGVPAAELYVTCHHKQLFHGIVGYSDRQKTKKAAADDLYYLYSSSKVMTVAAGLRLMEEGKLKLDDPVSRYLPAFSHMTVRDGEKVRPAQNTLLVKHLFKMTGGFNYQRIENPEIATAVRQDPDADTLKIINALAKSPLDFEPGTHYAYSLCHDVLGAVIEAAAGMRFSDYVKERFCRPLGITDLYYHVTPAVRRRLTAHYNMEADFSLTELPKENDHILTPAYESGGAGIITTAGEYIKFADALASFGVGENGNRILSEDSVRMLMGNTLTGDCLKDYMDHYSHHDGYRYGLGVRVHTDEGTRYHAKSSYGEFGWGGAAGTYLLADPVTGIAVFYAQEVMNMRHAYPEHPHNVIRDMVYKILQNEK